MRIDPETFKRRRRQLAGMLGADAVAVIPGARVQRRNGDCDHPFRQDSDFLYLCGFQEPDATLVISSDGTSLLFCRERDPLLELWHGGIVGPQRAQAQVGVGEAHPVAAVPQLMPPMLARHSVIWIPDPAPAGRDGFHAEVLGWLQSTEAGASTSQWPALADLRPLVAQMRMVKDEQELAVMREAARITCRAHVAAMQRCARMMHEGHVVRGFDLEAEVLYECRRSGAQAQAYPSNVASGANACVLHHLAGDSVIHDGELVLLDAGCELHGYASDVTRTFPANGRFSDAQREVYQVVLASRDAGVRRIRPGGTFQEIHQAALRVLVEGMLDLGLLPRSELADPDAAIQAGAHTRFFMHSTSHWLGLDYHDAGPYFQPGASAPAAGHADVSGPPGASIILRPGMVMTVEPALYIRAAADIPARYHDMAVRIEDDVFVTHDGAEVISTEVPVAAEEIERLMSSVPTTGRMRR